MTKSFALGAALALTTLAASVSVHATDRWEGGVAGDDANDTRNTLSPGLTQEHDLDQAGGPAEDVDWAAVPTLQYHSYEARISGANVNFDWGLCPPCAQFERVNSAGAVLTEDVATVNNGSGGPAEAYDRSVRWMASGSTFQEFVRVTGATLYTENATFGYTLRYWDSTYTVPRWNASGTQTTVFIITSLVQGTVTGNVHFFSGAGTLLHSQAITLNPNVPLVLSTAALAPLAGQSGYALVSHTAGYGGLTGKAVALEPSTGFTFDTAMAAIPQ
jgi:hypothetical protein